ncbi:MAG: chorismate mutase [Candidatus Enteromonas sp.]|nr:chorismate mutase [Candidatus Enteromonas sp.]
MNKLEECRLKIDAIDNEIIRLYEERMKAVKDIAEYKNENGLEVLDSSREKTMLEKNLLKISNVELKKYYHHVLTGFLDASKEMQKEIIAKK